MAAGTAVLSPEDADASANTNPLLQFLLFCASCCYTVAITVYRHTVTVTYSTALLQLLLHCYSCTMERYVS